MDSKLVLATFAIGLIVLFSLGCIKKELPLSSEKIPKNETNNMQTTNGTISKGSQQSTNVVKVAIKYFAFTPNIIRISPGTTVIWENEDENVIHEIKSGYILNHRQYSDGLFDSGELTFGESWNYTFTKTGEYPYFSPKYPQMQGLVIVGNPEEKEIQIVTPHFVGSIPQHNQTLNSLSEIWITFSVPVTGGKIQLYDVIHNKTISLSDNGVVTINYLRLRANVDEELAPSLYKVVYDEERPEGNYTGQFFFRIK